MPHYLTPYIIERVTVLLKDKETTATIYPIFESDNLPENLLLFLTQEYNDEVARGDTQPFFDPLTPDEFHDFWFGQFAAVMIIGDNAKLNRNISVKEWATKCLGTMFIKTNYPGRSAHVGIGNVLVNAGIRRKGIGTTLTECMVRWAPRLGYSYLTVELVFDSNTAAKQVLERLHFKKVGRVKGAGLLKSTKDVLIDSLTYGRELQLEQDDENATSRHEQIKNYLTSGQYPDTATRQEKSRLRALAYHYNMRDGRLYLKDKEVISSVHEQFQIARRVHLQSSPHLGINKTTTIICEKYHWPKVKETVVNVIRQCSECKDPGRNVAVRSQGWIKPKSVRPTVGTGISGSTAAAIRSKQLISGIAPGQVSRVPFDNPTTAVTPSDVSTGVALPQFDFSSTQSYDHGYLEVPQLQSQTQPTAATPVGGQLTEFSTGETPGAVTKLIQQHTQLQPTVIERSAQTSSNPQLRAQGAPQEQQAINPMFSYRDRPDFLVPQFGYPDGSEQNPQR